MANLSDPADDLRLYLGRAREALIWKLDGLNERQVRLPLTPTGTNLLGIIKHCANVEIGYFGPTFGREWTDTDDPSYVAFDAYDDGDPQLDWWLPAEVSTAQLVDFYRRVAEFSDAAFDELPLDTLGRVPWWPEETATRSLHRIAIHVMSDLARHAGQADVLREHLDGAVGMLPEGTNIEDGYDWPGYVARLTSIAEQFPA